MTLEQVCKLDLKPIETVIWEPHPANPGFIRKLASRKLVDIALELEERLTAFEVEYEYVSIARARDLSIDKEALFPDTSNANEIVHFEKGGNEGYSIYIGVEEFRNGLTKHDREQFLNRPIRIKILSGREEAFVAYAFVFRLFMG